MGLFSLLQSIAPRRTIGRSNAFLHRGEAFYRRRDGGFVNAAGHRIVDLDACFLLGQAEAMQRTAPLARAKSRVVQAGLSIPA